MEWLLIGETHQGMASVARSLFLMRVMPFLSGEKPQTSQASSSASRVPG